MARAAFKVEKVTEDTVGTGAVKRTTFTLIQSNIGPGNETVTLREVSSGVFEMSIDDPDAATPQPAPGASVSIDLV